MIAELRVKPGGAEPPGGYRAVRDLDSVREHHFAGFGRLGLDELERAEYFLAASTP